MAPKSKKNKSQPEKSAELKEGWADKLPLKYDDKTYGDRFGIKFFAENLNSEILSDTLCSSASFMVLLCQPVGSQQSRSFRRKE